jgi:UrcA family protein
MKTYLLCGALMAFAVPASAAEVRPTSGDPDILQTTVNYADLDLNRPAGADVMIARVRRAARTVCHAGMFLQHSQVRRTHACVRQAMTGAFAQVDAPLVTSRFLKTAPQAELAAR